MQKRRLSKGGEELLLEMPEGKWNRPRQRMARRLLDEQDTVLRSYFEQKYGEKPTCVIVLFTVLAEGGKAVQRGREDSHT